MPIAPENTPSRPTAFQQRVMAIHATLDAILTAEGRDPPELVFGQLQQGKFDRPPRIGWQEYAGHFVDGPDVRLSLTADEIPLNRLGVDRTLAQASLWHVSPEQAKHMLRRLWMACDRTTPQGSAFLWLDHETRYVFTSESVGEWLKNGCSLLVLNIAVDVPVERDYDGEFTYRQVTAEKLRGGINLNISDPNEPTERAVEEFTEPVLP